MCVCVVEGLLYDVAYTWRSRDNLLESVLSTMCVLGMELWSSGLHSKLTHFYPSHLTSPVLEILLAVSEMRDAPSTELLIY